MIARLGKTMSSSNLTRREKRGNKEPNIDEMIASRDYSGAIAVLEFYRSEGRQHPKYATLPWLGYCYFHLGEYEKACLVYEELMDQELKKTKPDTKYHLYAACCKYFLGLYKEAEEEAEKGLQCSLQHRILFHIADKVHDEEKFNQHHKLLQDSIDDQLSLAAMHYSRSLMKEATEIFKPIIVDDSSYLALNVYVSMCYYKLDYYDISTDVLNPYLMKYPDSIIANNLKACNNLKIYNGKVAEQDLQHIIDLQNSSYSIENPLIKHNLVVFRNGENALQVLPPLIDVIPEARLNLAIYHLKQDDIDEAFNLIKDVEPSKLQEYILKGVVHASLGQRDKSREQLKRAQQFFQLVGASEIECDTIPGRQCMASCYFLLKQFEEVLIYLRSIQTFFVNDDDFNWNFGITQAAAGMFREAEETLLHIQNEKYKNDPCYITWLAKCYIMNGKPALAWELYPRMEQSGQMNLLHMIGNECYRMGKFYYAAKAFDSLERMDPNPDFWDAKRGACIGVFQQVLAGKELSKYLKEVLTFLENTSSNHQQVESIIRIIKKGCKEHKIMIEDPKFQ